MIRDSGYSTAEKSVQAGNLSVGSVDKHSYVDTTTASAVLNDVLKWNGSDWVPGTAGDTTEFTFSIDTFDDGISGGDLNQLIGAGQWKAVGEVTFTATYSNKPDGMTATVAMSGSNTDWAGDLARPRPEGAGDTTGRPDQLFPPLPE